MNPISDWDEIVHNLQIDITSHCNARCSMCVRQIDGSTQVKPDLPLHHFDTDVWNRLAQEDTRGWYIKELTLNGNWGDPMMHPNLVEFLDTYSRAHPETRLMIHTNGSMRTTEFWHNLAEVSRKFYSHVVMFAVDGLADTHSIYRVRTKFDKIIENIKAFTNNAGRARVIMTVFEHNKHQIKQVQELAEQIGCIEFAVRNSHGAHTIQDGIEIKDADVEEYNVDFQKGVRMSSLRDMELWAVINDSELPELNTACPWFNDRRVQIDPWASVWPCCHVSPHGISYEGDKLEYMVDKSFIRARKTNNLTNHNLKDILCNGWFSDHLPKAVETAAWKECRDTCGVCKNG